MALANVLDIPAAGFNFDNVARNATLNGLFKGGEAPTPMKTGTTIAGIVFKDGVVLGADTRETNGEVVANKTCSKIHYIAPNIYCCGAGVAADTEKTTDILSSNLTIFSLNSGRNPRVIMAVNILQDMLYRYHGEIGASLILGGVDCTGNHLYSIGPYGSVIEVPYLTMGSGSLAAVGILEDSFRHGLELEEAKELVRLAIHAGIMCDLGSGNNVDICVITRKGVDYIRPYQESEFKDNRKMKYKYRPGTTPILTEKVVPLKLEVVTEMVQQMDTAIWGDCSSVGKGSRPWTTGSVVQSLLPATCQSVLGQDTEPQVAPGGSGEHLAWQPPPSVWESECEWESTL